MVEYDKSAHVEIGSAQCRIQKLARGPVIVFPTCRDFNEKPVTLYVTDADVAYELAIGLLGYATLAKGDGCDNG